MISKVITENKFSLVAGFLAMSSPLITAQETKQPNIVYILIDDMSAEMLQGNPRFPFIKLPNISRLQKEGVTFDNFFCVQSLSSPSRASNLTGMYGHANGITQNFDIDPDWEKTKPFSVFLKQAGYTNAFIGKLHMGNLKAENQIRPGFDSWISFRGQGVYTDPLIFENGKEVQRKGYITDILTDYAVDWIRDKREKSRPFSLCIWHKALHGPFTPAAHHKDMYRNEKLTPPKGNAHLDDLSTKPQWQRAKVLGNEANVPEKVDLKKTYKKGFEAIQMSECLLAVDESVGKIMDALEKEGELDNTLIVFSSDNGYFYGEHQLNDKRLAYEPSIRIPMIMRYPKLIKPGIHISEMCLNIDLAPTFTNLAGMKVPAQFQGKSMRKLLAGEKDNSWRKSFLYEYFIDNMYPTTPDMTAIRTERYKYVDNTYRNNTDIDELYDLKKDPGECDNLINNLKYSKILDKLKKELEELKQKYQYNPDRNWWWNKFKKNNNN